MLEYKVIKFPPWLFSTKSNTPLRRNTHAPNSHRWSPLSWFCLLRRRPLFFFHVTYQLSQLRLRLIYNRSMLEYKVIKFPPWLFPTKSNTPLGRKTHAPAVTDGHCYPDSASWGNDRYFPIDSRSDSGVTVEQQQFNFELFVPSLGLTWNIH